MTQHDRQSPCDGDPIECSHEAARRRAEAAVDRLGADVLRLRAGEATEPAPEGVKPTPAQFLRKWNDATAEWRLRAAEHVLLVTGQESACFLADHESQLEYLEAERNTLVQQRDHAAVLIRAQKQPCPEHQSPLPRPSCWHCARNGALERAARIVLGEFLAVEEADG